MDRYPEEDLNARKDQWGYTIDEDDGTMPANVDRLRQSVIGRRIVSADKRKVWMPWYEGSTEIVEREAFVITLDDGTQVRLRDSSLCCAYTGLEAFLLHPDKVDHIIMGVGTTDGYRTWHIYADLGDVLELTVDWSCGNPFYYGYGFDIDVVPIDSPGGTDA